MTSTILIDNALRAESHTDLVARREDYLVQLGLLVNSCIVSENFEAALKAVRKATNEQLIWGNDIAGLITKIEQAAFTLLKKKITSTEIMKSAVAIKRLIEEYYVAEVIDEKKKQALQQMLSARLADKVRMEVDMQVARIAEKYRRTIETLVEMKLVDQKNLVKKLIEL